MGFGGGGSAAAFSGILPATTAEQGSAVIVDDADTGLASGTSRAYGQAFILPATSKFWLITGIEWKNGTAVLGNVLAGIDKIGIDTVPPTETALELVAYSTDILQVGISSIQRNSSITQTKLLGKGEILIPWISPSSITGRFRFLTTAAQNSERVITDSRTFPQWKPTTAWTASIARYYMKAYFTGYG